MTEPLLAISESTRLAELEIVIERGLTTFVEVGNALMEIRDSRLYRSEFGTFESYVLDRWGWQRQTAYGYIDAAKVALNVSDRSDIPTLRHAQMLAPLQPEQQRELAPIIAELPVREAREVVRATRMDVHYSSETDEWSTPQDLFDLLDAEFRFEIDVCATAENAKCKRFFVRGDNSLEQSWTGTCWMNPPYGRAIVNWVEKAWFSAEDGATVVCLLPARVDTDWWWSYCRHGEVRFLRGRLKFGNAEAGAPFPSAVVVFPRPASVIWWEREAGL